MKRLFAVATCVALGGCATVTRGTTDQVQVMTTPAGAQVTTSIGNQCPATPCTFEVARKSEFILTVKKDGFRDSQVPVSTRIAGSGAAGFAGNILVGGIVGMGVDAATGSTLEHYPNPVSVTLVPLAPPPGKQSKRKPTASRPKSPPVS